MIPPERVQELMREAIDEARQSLAEDPGIHPLVGAILTDHQGNIIARAHRGEEGKGDHAEFIALEKTVGKDLSNAFLFVTLEPCTTRGPGKKPCAQRIIESNINTVFLGMLDPNPNICGRGENYLRWNPRLSVERFPSGLIKEIEQINSEFIKLHSLADLPGTSLYVTTQIADLICEELRRQRFDLDELPADWDFTIDDLAQYCASAVDPSIDGTEVTKLVHQARGIAFDKKYADYTYDRDTRGLGDHWQREVRAILRSLRAEDYPRRRVINVGIGNGLEGPGLFDTVEHLTVVDIAPKSLERSKGYLPRATILQTNAEDLGDVRSRSQDIYVSLRTYQSSYFNVTRALQEAHRVIRPGGIILISVANGFLGEDGALIPGLVIPRSSVVDRDRPFTISERIRKQLTLWHFEEVGIRTGWDEIYIYGRRGRW